MTALFVKCLFTSFITDRAAYQRTVGLGKRFILDWVATELDEDEFETRRSFALWYVTFKFST